MEWRPVPWTPNGGYDLVNEIKNSYLKINMLIIVARATAAFALVPPSSLLRWPRPAPVLLGLPDDPGRDDAPPGGAGARQSRRGEALGSAEIGPFHRAAPDALHRGKMGCHPLARAPGAAPLGSRTLPASTCGIRVAGCCARAERKDMEPSGRIPRPAPASARTSPGLGREARDDIGSEHQIRRAARSSGAERDRLFARMPALHPLQDQVVPRPERQMDAASAGLAWIAPTSFRIGPDRVDRGCAAAAGPAPRPAAASPVPELRRPPDRRPQLVRSTGQHHPLKAREPRHLLDHRRGRNAAANCPARTG